MTDAEAAIILNMLPQVGPVRFGILLERFGSADSILAATGSALRGVEGIEPDVSSVIASWREHADLDAELSLLKKSGGRVLTWNDPEYPELHREIHDPPIVLYLLGKLDPRDQRIGIGIVGKRRASHYATEATKKLGYQLAYAGLTVYSGLARGIDTAAHQAAIAANGRTVAVLGSGLAQIYPEENVTLAEKIAAGHGAVISEFPMGTTPTKQTFPKRNRIISGCSFGLLVVETGLNSSAVISAREAGEQGRSLYAVPGRIDHPGTLGSNRLIQQGAKLVINAGDIRAAGSNEEPTARRPLRRGSARVRSDRGGSDRHRHDHHPLGTPCSHRLPSPPRAGAWPSCEIPPGWPLREADLKVHRAQGAELPKCS